MDGDFGIDIGEIKKSIDVAEVVALYFPLLRKTLIVDPRHNAVDGPMIKVVAMAKSPHDRFRSLRKLRPRFGSPETITVIPWTRYVESLKRLGVWQMIQERLQQASQASIVAPCDKAYNELARLERKETIEAIRGSDRYETLWQRPDGR
ncbi:MAG: hypothetical protein HY677_00500 [Chloroflexi bacterium]|nr:hypothetical protein [Chloroflexota bacterium]